MNLKNLHLYLKARKIVAQHGKSTKVVILGSHAGMEILSLPEADRHCNIIGIVDDFRCQEIDTLSNVPIINSATFSELTKKHHNLIAINTCEHKKPKEYFNQLCQKNHVTYIRNWQVTTVFNLHEHFPSDTHYAYLRRKLRYQTRNLSDWLIRQLGSRKSKGDNIAILRLDGAGDFFIWLDSAQHIREYYAGRKITLFCNAAWAEYAKTLPYWDLVIPVDYHHFVENVVYRWRVMMKLRFGHYAITINPIYFRSLTRDDQLIRASNSPERIGWHGISLSATEFARSNPWYTKILQPNIPIRPEIERNAEFTSLLTGKTIAPAIASLPLRTDSAPSTERPYVLLFPGASWHGRRWPTNKFSDLANKLIEQFDFDIVLSGSKSEKHLCDEVEAKVSSKVINLAGKTNWVELVELIRGAKVLISNETSAIHIAPAVNTTSICILGGGHYGLFAPYPPELVGNKPLVAIKQMDCYGCNWHCSQAREARGAVPCIRDIEVKDVLDLVHNALDENTDKTSIQPPVNVSEVLSKLFA